jgi:hypothetical protein
MLRIQISRRHIVKSNYLSAVSLAPTAHTLSKGATIAPRQGWRPRAFQRSHTCVGFSSPTVTICLNESLQLRGPRRSPEALGVSLEGITFLDNLF